MIQGLVFLFDEKDLLAQEELKGLRGVSIRNVEVPGNIEKLKKELASYSGKVFSIDQINSIKEKIYSHYLNEKKPLVVVSTPPQNITQGVLQLVIQESKLGDVKIKGNKKVSNEESLKRFHLEVGEPIETQTLSKDLHFFNLQPFQKANAIFSEGTIPLTTDVTVLIDRDKPYQFSTSTNNSGTKATGIGRVFQSVRLAGPLDTCLYFQYGSSYDFKSQNSYSGGVDLYLPGSHIIVISMGHTMTHVDLPEYFMKSQGFSSELSVAYKIPFFISEFYNGSFSLGVDLKRLYQSIKYMDLNFFMDKEPAKQAIISQVRIQYDSLFQRVSSRSLVSAAIIGSFGKVFPYQSNEAYDLFKEGAKNRYLYGQFSIRHLQKLFSQSSCFFHLFAQVATGALLTSEQMNLGGNESIRGYEEGAYNADQAVCFSAEFCPYTFSVLSLIYPKLSDEIFVYGFFDMGYGMNHFPSLGQEKWNYLLSIGLGLKYNMFPYIAAHIDLGFKLHEISTFSEKSYQWHFNLSANY